jgi:hypothetical protein
LSFGTFCSAPEQALHAHRLHEIVDPH